MDDDRISFLPLDLRDDILSRLPTQEAIRTTILSTRWNNVCSTLLNLNFIQDFFLGDDTTKPPVVKESIFIDYIYQTLSHQHQNSSINIFSLSLAVINPDAFTAPLTDWLSFALAHNVQNISLAVFFKFRLSVNKIPLTLFISNTRLTVLELTNITLTLSSPQLQFPNLKKLSLYWVEFDDVSATTQLLPCSLSSLRMTQCSWKFSFTALPIPAPNLKTLVLQGKHPFTKVQHCSTNLHELNYLGFAPDFYTYHFSSLKYASFIIPPNLSGPPLSNILKGLENVLDLFLGGFFIELLVKEGDLLLSQLPSCCSSLKHLSLDLYPTQNQFRVAMLILTRYPNLETLYIHIKRSGIDLKTLNNDAQWGTEVLQTDHMFRQLTNVEIEGCGENEIEINLVRYLLENGPAMMTMNVFVGRKNRDEKWSHSIVRDKINSLTKASPHTTVSTRRGIPGRSITTTSFFRKWERLPYWNDCP